MAKCEFLDIEETNQAKSNGQYSQYLKENLNVDYPVQREGDQSDSIEITLGIGEHILIMERNEEINLLIIEKIMPDVIDIANQCSAESLVAENGKQAGGAAVEGQSDVSSKSKSEKAAAILPMSRTEGEHSQPTPASSTTNSQPSRSTSRYPCPSCSKCFIKKSHLQDHLLVHSGKRPFKCEYCSKQFNKNSHLTNHLNAMHNPLAKKFQCAHCVRSFKTKGSLQAHMTTIHKALRPFKCDQCSESFEEHPKLRAHRLSAHRDPFQCPTCLKVFTTKFKLLEHLPMHTEERPFVCEHCSKGYKHKSALNYHQKLNHNSATASFQCEHCLKKFKHKKNFHCHLRFAHNAIICHGSDEAGGSSIESASEFY